MARLKDISAATGVSMGIISRIINQDPTLNVPYATRMKVINYADKVGYLSSKSSVLLAGKKIKIVSQFDEAELENNPYYLLIVRAIISEIEARNWEYVLVENSCCEEECDGIITVGQISDEDIKCVELSNKPTVYLNPTKLHMEADYVVDHLNYGINLVVDEIKRQKIKDVIVISGNLNRDLDDTDFRVDTFSRLAAESGIKFTIYNTDFTVDGGYMVGNKLAKIINGENNFIFACNDSIAIGLLKSFQENNICVPKQVQVIGYENIPVSKYVVPALTTVDSNMEEMGASAVKLIEEQFKGRVSNKHVSIVTKLVRRASTR